MCWKSRSKGDTNPLNSAHPTWSPSCGYYPWLKAVIYLIRRIYVRWLLPAVQRCLKNGCAIIIGVVSVSRRRCVVLLFFLSLMLMVMYFAWRFSEREAHLRLLAEAEVDPELAKRFKVRKYVDYDVTPWIVEGFVLSLRVFLRYSTGPRKKKLVLRVRLKTLVVYVASPEIWASNI